MSLMNLLIAARSKLLSWRERDQAFSELMSLDDRSLADIGLRRSEIPSVVAGTYHNEPSREPAIAQRPSFQPRRPHAA